MRFYWWVEVRKVSELWGLKSQRLVGLGFCFRLKLGKISQFRFGMVLQVDLSKDCFSPSFLSLLVRSS